jgi:UDPglucose 6-dehydrogenase
MRVAVVGLGKLGACLAAVAADAGHQVIGIDINQSTVDRINTDRRAPFFERGLDELIMGVDPDRFSATTDFSAVAGCELVIILVPTPSTIAEPRFSDSFVLAAIRSVAKHLTWGHGRPRPVIAVASTLMPGTMDGSVTAALAESSLDAPLVYSPFFVALGEVIQGMRSPDFCLIGASDRYAYDTYREFLQVLVGWSNPVPMCLTSLLEAETAKLAVNAYVTMKISFANTLGMLCDRLGADALRVVDVVGRDRRVGRQYLSPGGVFAGPCFPRDARAVDALGADIGVATPLATAAAQVNAAVVHDVMRRLCDAGKVAVLGLAYKPGTPVTDESLGLAVVERLKHSKTPYVAHDPLALPLGVALAPGAQLAIDAVDTVLISIPCPEYRHLDYEGRTVVDPWHLLRGAA